MQARCQREPPASRANSARTSLRLSAWIRGHTLARARHDIDDPVNEPAGQLAVFNRTSVDSPVGAATRTGVSALLFSSFGEAERR